LLRRSVRIDAVFTAADAYDRFMGRYSEHLSPQLADLAHVARGMRVLDVGCGPGALTAELVRRAGAASVAAVDPSEPFVTAVRTRNPGVDARVATAESLPFADDAFDAAVAQLVVHFMRDPVAGIREMARVTRTGGVVAACVWDGLGRGPTTEFWRAAREIDPNVPNEGERAGVREGHLVTLFKEAGLRDVEQSEVWSRLAQPSFESWWGPFELGVGPVGVFVARLSDAQRVDLRERCRALLPSGPFVHEVRAWAARGVV
jgi:SAM-dependent methyltransferase